MANTIVSEKMRRWHGTLANVCSLTQDAQNLIKTKTAIEVVPVSIRVFLKEKETEYYSLEEFTELISDEDYSRLDRLIVTIGDFARTTPLNTEIVLSNVIPEPAIHLKARGHDEAYVAWLVKELHQRLERGARALRLSNTALAYFAFVVYLVGQYCFFTYVSLPSLSSWEFYVLLIFVSILPTIFLIGTSRLFGWFFPQVEFVKQEGSTRWSRNRRKAVGLVTTFSGALSLPFVAPLILGLLTDR